MIQPREFAQRQLELTGEFGKYEFPCSLFVYIVNVNKSHNDESSSGWFRFFHLVGFPKAFPMPIVKY